MQPRKGEVTNAQILAGKAQLRDEKGEFHDVKVTVVESITKPLQCVPLSKEDRTFLHNNNIKLSIDPRAQSIQPKILGCGDMFPLLDNGLVPKKILPSGLLLISSKLGNLITGANERDHTTSDNSTVLFMETKDSTNELEEQSWDEFCTFESTGIHEYTEPTSKERELENAAIWKEFEETIEKRDDGYYVRLPWRYNANTLPDNKGMAIKRLHATLKALKNKPAILHKYNETIEEQLQQNVIEEVDESSPNREAIVHHLPHQAVLTPNKETTPPRV
ncbi:hypothetical protein DICVIV_08001, partial [Dictyocaulus viviparus]